MKPALLEYKQWHERSFEHSSFGSRGIAFISLLRGPIMGGSGLVGGVGQSLLFFFSMIALIITSAIVFAYASHSYLTVVENTAAGNDEVHWPSEIFYDWLWKLFYMGWLIAIGWVPTMLTCRVLLNAKDPELLKRMPGLDSLIAAGVAFWLVLPFVFLSSLSANSRWIVFRWTVLRRMLHKLPAVLAFYFLAAFVVGAALAATGVFLMRPSFIWLPVFAVAWASAILIHARLLGRLGGQIVRVELKQAAPPPRKRKRRRPTPENPDEWDVPVAERNRQLREGKPVIHLPFDGAVEPYLLTESAAPVASPQPRPKPFEEPGDPYEMAAETEPPTKVEPPLDGWLPVGVQPPPRLPHEPKQPISPDELETQILLTRQEKPANFSFMSGTFSFPWYPTTRDAWLRLCFGFAVMGLFFVFMASLLPRG